MKGLIRLKQALNAKAPGYIENTLEMSYVAISINPSMEHFQLCSEKVRDASVKRLRRGGTHLLRG